MRLSTAGLVPILLLGPIMLEDLPVKCQYEVGLMMDEGAILLLREHEQ